MTYNTQPLNFMPSIKLDETLITIAIEVSINPDRTCFRVADDLGSVIYFSKEQLEAFIDFAQKSKHLLTLG